MTVADDLRAARALIAAGAVLLLAACGANPIETQSAPNGFKAEFIGEVDGCRIWRVRDERTVYFARCPEGPATTRTDYLVCAKVCTNHPIELVAARATAESAS